MHLGLRQHGGSISGEAALQFIWWMVLLVLVLGGYQLICCKWYRETSSWIGQLDKGSQTNFPLFHFPSSGFRGWVHIELTENANILNICCDYFLELLDCIPPAFPKFPKIVIFSLNHVTMTSLDHIKWYSFLYTNVWFFCHPIFPWWQFAGAEYHTIISVVLASCLANNLDSPACC